MPPFFPQVLLLFGGIEHTSALALFGRQPNTTLPLDRRQGTVLASITRFSTIFFTGDASKTRTANPGFDCRVDILHDLWGFCPSSVIAATDCGLAGSCVDSFSCSKGCGFTNSPLTTFTCSESGAPFCSTALLTLSNNVGPFTYLACGAGPSTDRYFAFTTTAKPSSSSAKPTPSTSTTTSSSPRETASTHTASSTAQSSNQSSSPSNTASPAPASSNEATSASSPNNTGAIIGGTFGCLALLCSCIVVIFWIRHRNARNVGSKTPKTLLSKTSNSGRDTQDDSGHDPSAPPPLYKSATYQHEVAELSGRDSAAYDPSGGNWQFGVGSRYPCRTPVELPGSGFGVGGGSRG